MSPPRRAAAPRLVDVAILGAGPAGAAAAIGLRRLGYSVAIFGRNRRAAIEGLSARTIARLRAAQLHTAADYAAAASPRFAVWAGRSTAQNIEFLVERRSFDRSLGCDLSAAGIDPAAASVIGVAAEAGGWRVATSAGNVCSLAVLEARGRRARRDDQRGPRLVAWSETFRCTEPRERGSAVVALNDGWVWLANDGTGLLQRQFVGDVRQSLPIAELHRRFAAAETAIPQMDFARRGAVSIGRALAYAAVARCSRPAQAPGFIRIGDAAVAMDPLSGQGVYEALGSAQVAVAALNSFLAGAAWLPIAQFLDQRCGEIWRRSLATAGSFYRSQADHVGPAMRPPCAPATTFWDDSAGAYERLAAMAGLRERGPGRVEMRPVLNGSRIELRQVWVDSRRPRGVWTSGRHRVAADRHIDSAGSAYSRGSR